MVERGRGSGVTPRGAPAAGAEQGVFFVEVPLAAGAPVTLSEADAHHIRVARLDVGARVGLRDGAGAVARGTLVRVSRGHAIVAVETVHAEPPPEAVHLLGPVADRDRMLWLAEKAAELGVASWRPVVWRRSRGVAPRGDGPTFRGKVRARMIAALLQSRGAWLPEIFPEAPLERAIAAAPRGTAVVLHPGGVPMAAIPAIAPVVVAVGPEGGLEPDELVALDAAGFVRTALGQTVLRFETAAVAGVAVARALLSVSDRPAHADSHV